MSLFKSLSIFLLLLFGIGQVQGQLSSSSPIILQVKNREITVNGRKSQVYEIVQPNGQQGLALQKGDLFHVIVENHIESPTGIHWHGLIVPNSQDGVPYVTQLPIPPGGKYFYHFPLLQSGTFWMHAHYGLQEQKLLAAPLILYDSKDQPLDQQNVIMFISDFSFLNPYEIFRELRHGGMKGGMHGSATGHSEAHSPMKMDLNDVKYDAFLANWRTLSEPDIIRVIPGKTVRLRVINGSSSTNFFIDLGKLKGEVIAVDGEDIIPLSGSRFELAVGQRIDVRVPIPQEFGAHPIIAQVEGLKQQTGLILATADAKIPQLKEETDQPADALSYKQELMLQAKHPLTPKEINRRLIVNLEGSMADYIWLINGKAWPYFDPLMVKQGERVEMIFVNKTGMSHPMHLHGHSFQVTEVDGKPIHGAMRDVILVLPHTTAKVQFDANNSGNWPFHCHNLYHQYGGMMTTMMYEGFKGPFFKIEPEH